MTTTFMATEIGEDAEEFMAPKRYRAKLYCERCENVYYSPWRKAPPKVDPPCPRKACATARATAAQQVEIDNLKAMIAAGQGPAHIGANTVVRAVDETAKIVMEDYKMTNLQDNVRMGDSVAAKLPPEQQKQADNYFGAKGMSVVGAPGMTVSQRQMKRIGAQAMAGAYKGMAVAPTAIVPGAVRGQPALRHVGNEPTGRRNG